MVNPVEELKTRAEILHRRVASGSPEARARLRALAGLAKANDAALVAAAPGIRRKHCLAVVAREHGFTTWAHARRVLGGDEEEADFGTLLYPAYGGALNVWFADYEEARAHLREVHSTGARRYLLPYRRQFFVADRSVIEALGLDPGDDDWNAIDDDWVRPRDPEARRRLYQKLLSALRGQS